MTKEGGGRRGEGGGRREKRKGKIPEGGIPRLGSLEKDSIIMVGN